jgi:hypothetical protein
MKLDELNPLLFHRKSFELYYGTCRGHALNLDNGGHNISIFDTTKELILVSTLDMAKEQAESKECDAILKVSNVPFNSLRPYVYRDKTSVADMVKSLSNGEPIKVKLVKNHKGFTYINKSTYKRKPFRG